MVYGVQLFDDGLDRRVMIWARWLARVLVVIALLWSLWIGWEIWASPMRYEGIRISSSADGQSTREELTELRSFSEASEYGVLPLVIPVLLASLGVWGIWRGRPLLVIASALLVTAFVFMTGFSIGGAYLPASACLVTASIALGFSPDRVVPFSPNPIARKSSSST